MNKRRWIMMLALPLVLGVLLGAAKWKQMHPVATQRDLVERAHLRQATIAELVVNGRATPLPIDEFKATLNDFYLLDSQKESNSSGFISGPVSIVRVDTIRLLKSRQEPHYLAQIGLSSPASYTGNYPYKSLDKLLDKSVVEQHISRLHPVTERRLRAFVARHRCAN